MKVLVTGGCGFLGSHVCEYYSNKGNEVISVDNLTKYELMRTGYNVEGTRFHNYDFLKGLGVTLVEADICDKDLMFDLAKDCDYIIHTAAQPSMVISIEEPELDLRTNVVGTLNSLEAARKYKIPIVYCSTIHVYGNEINKSLKEGDARFYREPPAIDESHPILEGEMTPLHASKRAAELYIQTYIDTYGLEAATFRLTGMYGPRQFGGEDHGWVANFAIRTIRGLPIKVFGTNKQVRDILYASDAVMAFEAFYNSRKPGIYNIGGGVNNIISLGECLDMISEITGKKQEIKYEPIRLGDLWYYVSDISRAEKELCWKPCVSNREGVSNLINWINDNIELFGG
jgi:CDP-paratose 2-epimerase